MVGRVGGQVGIMQVGELGGGEGAYGRMRILTVAEDGEGIEEGRGVGETMDSGGIVVESVHGRGCSGEWAGEMEGREEEK